MAPFDATAIAHPNIALVKYWGKRDAALNLPATGSLSITLDELRTTTRVRFSADLPADELVLGGVPAPGPPTRHTRVLDLLRAAAGTRLRARIESDNDFPTAAGLASSASGFAALTVAADAALDLQLPARRLSEIARHGSGSAARSIFGGFAEMLPGSRPDGTDSFAVPLLDASAWPLSVVIAVTSTGTKPMNSGAGMELSRRTSPLYHAWVDSSNGALAEARTAIERRDFAGLAAISEHSSTTMHAVMLSTRPALIYWNGATVDCLHVIRNLRETRGVATFSTVDAGPQVKAVCLPEAADTVAAALHAVPGVLEVRTVGLGDGAHVPAAQELTT